MRIAAWTALWLAVVIGWASPSWSAVPGRPASLTIATASPGGVYLVYGKALAAVLTEALGMPVEAQATQGTDQNILLIDSGDAQLGFVTTGTALQAWNGSGAWTHGKKLRSMRALFPMYDTPLQFLAAKSSGIGSLQTWPTSGSARAPRAALQERMHKRSLRRSGSPRPYALAPGTPSAHSCTPAFSMLLSARRGPVPCRCRTRPDWGNPLRSAQRRRNRQAAQGDARTLCIGGVGGDLSLAEDRL